MMADQERQQLVAAAEQAFSDYPQFAGHWDTWTVATMARRVYRHGKTFADKGERVLVCPERGPDGLCLIYSRSVQVDVHVRPDYLEAT